MPSTESVLVIALSGILLLSYVHRVVQWRRRSRGLPLPPGPSALPIVGNLYTAPNFKSWEGYQDLCDKYGDIIHLSSFGVHVVVLGSSEIILEYLEKRSANTSDREPTPLIELTGSHVNFAFMPYSQKWRRHRRAFWQYFNSGVIKKYHPAQEAVTRKFLVRLLRDPTNLVEHVRYNFSASMAKTLYDVEDDQDIQEFMTMIERAQEGVAAGLLPGRHLIEFFPFLRHVPEWFPRSGLKKLSRKWIAAAMHLKIAPFVKFKETLSKNEGIETGQSIIGQMLAQVTDKDVDMEDQEDLITNVGMVAFVAGADTTYSTLQALFLAMSLNPEVLRKAHAELDAVVGPDRLPNFSDREELVYVNAIIKEVMRWHTVVPLSVPHSTVADDELHGYFIPAGTVLLPNSWACMHDPNVFDAPFQFRPERFNQDGKLTAGVRDPAKFVFGYGRRICPGRYFAEDALFINISNALHVFDISPPLDERGAHIAVVPDVTDGLLSYPTDCRCTIKPRSPQAERLILS